MSNNINLYYEHICSRIESNVIIYISLNEVPIGQDPDILLYYVGHTEFRLILEYAIINNKTKTIIMMLDYFKVPTHNMTVKERICYYQLLND